MILKMGTALVAIGSYFFSGPAAAQGYFFEKFTVGVVQVHGPVTPRLVEEDPFLLERMEHIIEEAAQHTAPNFAGHYIVQHLGCGTQCGTGALIDVLTGEMCGMPTWAHGVEFHPNSRLLVANPNQKEDPPEWLRREYYVWTGTGFELVHEESTRVPML